MISSSRSGLSLCLLSLLHCKQILYHLTALGNWKWDDHVRFSVFLQPFFELFASWGQKRFSILWIILMEQTRGGFVKVNWRKNLMSILHISPQSSLMSSSMHWSHANLEITSMMSGSGYCTSFTSKVLFISFCSPPCLLLLWLLTIAQLQTSFFVNNFPVCSSLQIYSIDKVETFIFHKTKPEISSVFRLDFTSHG